MGNGTTFSVIAFSLGGPISLAFAGVYPSSVRSLVLLGPAGLPRKLPEGYGDQFMYHPERAPSPEALREKVREALGVAPCGPALDIQLDQRRATPVKASPSRVGKSFDMEGIFSGSLTTIEATSFPSRILSVSARCRRWICGETLTISLPVGQDVIILQGSELLVFFGRDDGIVVGEETTEDILKLLPPDHMQVEYLPRGHGFPYTNSETITRTILSSWSAGLSEL